MSGDVRAALRLCHRNRPCCARARRGATPWHKVGEGKGMFRSIGAIVLASFAFATLAQAASVSGRDPAAINAIVNAPLPDDQAAMKAHVMFLASDAMRGREAGSPEFDIAANYVAAQFYAAGLRPAGDQGSYLQKV